MTGGARSGRWTRAWDGLGHARWQGVGGLVGVISVLIALVGIYLQVHGGSDDPATPTAGSSPRSSATGEPGGPPGSPSPSPVAGTTSSAVGTAAPKPRFDGEITLPRQGGVDVDAADPAVVKGSSGATGGLDLFHDSGSVRADALLTPDGVFAYPAGATPAEAFDICTDYTGTAPSANVHSPNLGLTSSAGAVCFVTSDRHLAYAAVRAVAPGSQAATLAVRVWDQKVE